MDLVANSNSETMALLNQNEKSMSDEKLAADNKSQEINLKEAFCIIVGFSMGSAILVMPHIITVLGLAGWISALISIVVLQCTCIILLSKSTQKCINDKDSSKTCDPYQVVAEVAGGRNVKRISIVVMYFCDVSVSIAMYLLSSNILAVSIPITGDFKSNEQIWVAVLVLVLTPFMFLGTYTQLKLPAIISLVSALSSGILVLLNCTLKQSFFPSKTIPIAPHDGSQGELTHISNIFVALGTILFSTNGPSQVICNVTVLSKTKEKLHQSIIWSYICMFLVYLVCGLVPYHVFEGNIESSIIKTFSYFIKDNTFESDGSLHVFKGISLAVQIFMCSHLLLATLLSMNPVFLHLETVFSVPNTLGWKRMAVRGSCMAIILTFCLVIPNFQLALGISGGVPLTMLSVVLPLFMTLKIFNTELYQKILILFFIVLAALFAVGNLVAVFIGAV